MVPILVKGDDVISETKDRTGVNGVNFLICSFVVSYCVIVLLCSV